MRLCKNLVRISLPFIASQRAGKSGDLAFWERGIANCLPHGRYP